MRGPGRAEVQEEGRALSRDPGWRRLILLWTRSWRWGLGSLWEEGRRGPQAAQARGPALGTPQFWTEGRRWVRVFCMEDETPGPFRLTHQGDRGGETGLCFLGSGL